MNPLTPSFGAVPSPRDYRDIPLEAVAGASPLPDKHIEDVSVLPVWHQHKIGACVGHAAAKYAQHLNHIETGRIDKLSARFLYAIAKCRDNSVGEGTFPRLVAKLVKDLGVATENTLLNDTLLDHETYVFNRKETTIPRPPYADALPYRSGGFAFADVTNAESLKRAIVEGHGAIILVQVGAEWYTSKSGRPCC